MRIKKKENLQNLLAKGIQDIDRKISSYERVTRSDYPNQIHTLNWDVVAKLHQDYNGVRSAKINPDLANDLLIAGGVNSYLLRLKKDEVGFVIEESSPAFENRTETYWFLTKKSASKKLEERTRYVAREIYTALEKKYTMNEVLLSI